MDLVINQMVQFQHIHVSDRYRIIEIISCTSITQTQLAAAIISTFFQQLNNILLCRTVKYRCCDIPVFILCSQTQMNLQYLSDVHSRRYTQRVQHYLQRLPVFHKRHIFFRQDPRNNTFVSVTSSHLVSNADLSLGRDVAAHQLVNAWRQFVSVIS